MLKYCFLLLLFLIFMTMYRSGFFYALMTRRENNLEGFSPGNYPCEDDQLPLNDWYPSHKPEPEISGIPQWKQFKNYPIFPAKSTNINNIRQWRQPNNAQCTPNGLCGKFYGDRQVTMPKPPQCPGFEKRRVNFYNSDDTDKMDNSV